jgi:hypothetical protein
LLGLPTVDDRLVRPKIQKSPKPKSQIVKLPAYQCIINQCIGVVIRMIKQLDSLFSSYFVLRTA